MEETRACRRRGGGARRLRRGRGAGDHRARAHHSPVSASSAALCPDGPCCHPRSRPSSLAAIIYGGTPSSPTKIAEAIRRFGPVLIQFYGQNEAGVISALTPAEHDLLRPERLRSAGRPLPHVQVTIRDTEGRTLPIGSTGEICVRSATVMEGYWKQPQLIAEVLRDGWLHTGDVGFMDADGYLTVVDRFKDLIIVVGGHVYPTEVEDLLNSHPQIEQSAVFGVRDADAVERVCAVVVPATGSSTLTGSDVQAFVTSRWGTMYRPTEVALIDRMPLTDSGKPDKPRLRVMVEQGILSAGPVPRVPTRHDRASGTACASSAPKRLASARPSCAATDADKK
ncbi:AMP-binding protein [Streptomyces sp. CA-142005]|uniref:AMP-binding protein n=1 Tax=Streptomyces sp. CA-142005 TaxID=3240052 RepID=UPI003D8A5436